MLQRFQRVTSFMLAALLVAPLSLSAESRRGRGTSDLGRLAADLERALGKGSVEVRERERGSQPQPRVQSRPAPVVDPPRSARYADEAIVAAMNRQRAAYGLPPLRVNSRLSLAAEDRIDDMFRQRYFDHVAPDGTQPFVWVTRRGYRYRTVGENLAVGYRTAERVVDGWMDSPGHRANILNRSFDEVGLAIADGSPERGYGGPTVVALYASR